MGLSTVTVYQTVTAGCLVAALIRLNRLVVATLVGDSLDLAGSQVGELHGGAGHPRAVSRPDDGLDARHRFREQVGWVLDSCCHALSDAPQRRYVTAPVIRVSVTSWALGASM